MSQKILVDVKEIAGIINSYANFNLTKKVFIKLANDFADYFELKGKERQQFLLDCGIK